MSLAGGCLLAGGWQGVCFTQGSEAGGASRAAQEDDTHACCHGYHSARERDLAGTNGLLQTGTATEGKANPPRHLGRDRALSTNNRHLHTSALCR